MTYTNWQPGEPNGDMSGEDVIEMKHYSYVDNTRAKAGQWNDLGPGKENMAFLCSHECKKKILTPLIVTKKT